MTGRFALVADLLWTENAPLRRKRDSVFDNYLQRGSREKKSSGQSPSVLTKLASACLVGRETSRRALNHGGEFVHSEQISGFKREFDPGSESTLAACLTHASRTRKWSNP